MKHQIMLITYPDSLGGNLKLLKRALEEIVPGAVGSIHILPFFPSSGDRGFAPTTYDQVESAFGDWGDVESLAENHMLMCDMMVNHISRRSAEFQDYLRRGEKSPYNGMFFDYNAFFGGELEIADTPDHLLKLTRKCGPHRAVLEADLKRHTFEIQCSPQV